MRNILISALTGVLLIACSSDGERTVEFEPITTEKTVSLSPNEKESPQCHIYLNVLQAKQAASAVGRRINEAIVEKIYGMEALSVKAATDSFANQYTRQYVSDMLPLYREDRSDETKRPWYEYRYTVETAVEAARQGVTSYLITLDYYEGGAHGINQLMTLNFNNETGNVITLDSLFLNRNDSRLNELLLAQLLQAKDCDNKEQLNEKGYLLGTDMFASENFVISNDGLIFIYNPYEIAPYSEGQIKLNLSYDELKELLRP